MTVTVPVQVRLGNELVKIIDQRAADTGKSRADVLRDIVAHAVTEGGVATAENARDAVLDRLVDDLTAQGQQIETILDALRAAQHHATSAHAAARLGALMLLPADRQAEYVDKLAQVAR